MKCAWCNQEIKSLARAKRAIRRDGSYNYFCYQTHYYTDAGGVKDCLVEKNTRVATLQDRLLEEYDDV